MNKKIAIITCAYPPKAGGIGNNAYYHAKKLYELGYKVTVFAPKTKNKPAPNYGFKLKRLINVLPFGHAGFLVSLFWQLLNYDIIHLYYPFFGTDLIIYLNKLWHPDKKLVLHYEMDPIGQGWQKIFFAVYIKLFLGKMIEASDKVIILSWDHAQNSYLKPLLQKNKEKFVVIPNGIDTDIFKPQTKDEKLKKELGIDKNDKVVIFVGGLDSQHYFKGVSVLLKSFKQIVFSDKKIKLLIVGDGDLKEKYIKQAKDWRLGKKVIFTGWVDNEELPKYYALADLFVLPSTAKTESFGIVTAEAQACGVPAIVSNWPGSRQTIDEGETGFLVKPGQVEDLASRIKEVLKYDELRQTMGQKATERATQLYSWDKVIRQIDHLYQNLEISPAKKFFNWLWVALWMIIIFWSSSISDFSAITGDISQPSYDMISTLAHLFLYFILTWLLVRAFLAYQISLIKSLIFAFGVAIAYGAFDELHQFYVPGREVHLSDWGLDVLGSLITVIIYKFRK